MNIFGPEAAETESRGRGLMVCGREVDHGMLFCVHCPAADKLVSVPSFDGIIEKTVLEILKKGNRLLFRISNESEDGVKE